jgi:hypothetical protein
MRSLGLLAKGNSGDEKPYLISSLLEGEAAAMVALQMFGLKMSNEQREISFDNRSLFAPGSMPEIYSSTIQEVSGIIEHYYSDFTEETESWEHFKFRLKMLLTVFFVDLACSYPPPDHVQLARSSMDFEPGIRFIRLLYAFQILAIKPKANDFISALFNGKFYEAEAYLLQECEFPYPRAIEIYQNWLTFFDNLLADDDNKILLFRRNCCDQRVKDFSAYVRKTPLFLTNQSHLYWMTSRGLESVGSSLAYLDPHDKWEFVTEFLIHYRDLALADYFLETGKFICPLASVCEAATHYCLKGIYKNSLFPARPGCLIREGLEQAGFRLDA